MANEVADAVMTGDFPKPDQIMEQAQAAMPKLAPSLERRRLRTYLALVIGDVAILLGAFALAGWLYEGLFPHPTTLLQAQLLLPLFLTIALYQSVYSVRALEELRFAVGRVAFALLISTLLLNFILFYAKTNAVFSRVASTLALAIALAAMVTLRLAVRVFIARRWGGQVENVLCIADGGPQFVLPDALCVDAREAGLDPSSQDPHALDLIGRYLLNQDKVVVSCPRERQDDWAFVLKAAGVTGEVLSEPAHSAGAIGVSRYDRQGQSGLVVAMGPLGLRSRILKRGFDLAVAVTAMVLLAPLLLVIALAVKLGDAGPVLFVQPRTGRGNRLFPMLKFRTMHQGASDPAGSSSTAREDSRVTRIGQLLRRTSLDELPQLWNVVRGEMAIVGPRPHAIASLAGDKLFWEVDSRYWHRHSLKPGLTGLAQVRGLRGATDHEMDLAARLQADLEYISGWNLWRDMAIVMRTLFVLVHRKAY